MPWFSFCLAESLVIDLYIRAILRLMLDSSNSKLSILSSVGSKWSAISDWELDRLTLLLDEEVGGGGDWQSLNSFHGMRDIWPISVSQLTNKEALLKVKTFGYIRWMSSPLSQIILLRLTCLICESWLAEKVDGFSYQNRSPSRSLWNWSMSKHWTVGPTLLKKKTTGWVLYYFHVIAKLIRKEFFDGVKTTKSTFLIKGEPLRVTRPFDQWHRKVKKFGGPLVIGGDRFLVILIRKWNFKRNAFIPATRNWPFH